MNTLSRSGFTLSVRGTYAAQQPTGKGRIFRSDASARAGGTGAGGAGRRGFCAGRWYGRGSCLRRAARQHHADWRRARSEYWRQMLSDISGLQLDYRTGGDVGPALGAARLAQIAMNPQRPLSDLLPQLTLEQAHYPDAGRHALYQQRRETFRQIYQQLKPLMS